jgi:hypothetical protein
MSDSFTAMIYRPDSDAYGLCAEDYAMRGPAPVVSTNQLENATNDTSIVLGVRNGALAANCGEHARGRFIVPFRCFSAEDRSMSMRMYALALLLLPREPLAAAGIYDLELVALRDDIYLIRRPDPLRQPAKATSSSRIRIDGGEATAG